jgi:hypothetical protein
MLDRQAGRTVMGHNCTDIACWRHDLQLDIDIIAKMRIVPKILVERLGDALTGKGTGQFSHFTDLEGGSVVICVAESRIIVTLRFENQSNAWDVFLAIKDKEGWFRVINKLDYEEPAGWTQGWVNISFPEPPG